MSSNIYTTSLYKDVPPFTLPIISNKTLKHLVVIHRHGDRMSINPSHTSLKAPDGHFYEPGELTVKGKSQLTYLGKEMRKYVTQYKPLFSQINNKTIKTRSTNVGRTITSALYFLSAFLEQSATMNSETFEVRSEDKENMLISIEKRHNTIVTENRKTCDEVFLANPKIVELYQKYCRVYNISPKEEKYSNQIVNMCDTFNLFVCNDIPIQVNDKGETITPDDMKFAESIGEESFEIVFGERRVLGVFANEFLGDIVNDVENSIFGEPKEKCEMHLYSAHDVTLFMVLKFLGFKVDKWVPLASYIILEIFEDGDGKYVVRLSYNSQVLKLKCQGESELCEWDVFKGYVKETTKELLEDIQL
ncbi:hypothetical protein EIN_427850 [Entamoeba invadens IP1]|uniref:Acid phosphatase n=1 Tax=Entamoeba invadens IP1 TaxID=370355 RepID=A0A0A1UGS8_ENTIV|nr:hypothetical protein EIN_427850 [Entamoeba invadens IP1]ELP95119.1 hypothetical protein EIN_427850 [Entamoeba invadens IP1]|eukprot:XP_004261890.1 hypothetical protein EIN_427850 [Entamoeba invadens IP1]